MTETMTLSERELLQKFRELSEEKQREALDFISFLLSKVRTGQQPSDQTETMSKAETIVEETWGSIPLDRETAKYIAEGKELEYDV